MICAALSGVYKMHWKPCNYNHLLKELSIIPWEMNLTSQNSIKLVIDYYLHSPIILFQIPVF